MKKFYSHAQTTDLHTTIHRPPAQTRSLEQLSTMTNVHSHPQYIIRPTALYPAQVASARLQKMALILQYPANYPREVEVFLSRVAHINAVLLAREHAGTLSQAENPQTQAKTVILKETKKRVFSFISQNEIPPTDRSPLPQRLGSNNLSSMQFSSLPPPALSLRGLTETPKFLPNFMAKSASGRSLLSTKTYISSADNHEDDKNRRWHKKKLQKPLN